MGNPPGGARTLVAVVGLLVVTAYAALLALNALVLDPLGAVPGQRLDEIHAELRRQGFGVTQDIVVVLVTAGVGVVIAAVLVWLLHDGPAHVTASALLAVVAFGAPVSWWCGFALGMDVADGYGVGGGDHTIWAGVLYCTSLAALVAIPVVLVIGQARLIARRRRRLAAG
ncbi:hypothetical protein DEJ23_08090 [Curtobacterium sp. MCSS17_008]|uniref:hypothetical protein n=1 Tax=Curtobacterium sp. MCSS17_008 TaxID=2175647 RepID=UPI000DA9D691|nr:hypothetical protein [Curtobacterium sp. MCSS17_008]PZF57427.1 hypothetical protein DEJ23_08090 [Curtobacterium sp. MCSS17_008]